MTKKTSIQIKSNQKKVSGNLFEKKGITVRSVKLPRPPLRAKPGQTITGKITLNKKRKNKVQIKAGQTLQGEIAPSKKKVN